MRIGQVSLANAVISAPMAGVTDKAYRILAQEAGCGLVCTEMVSDQALLYGNPKTCSMLNLSGEVGPLSVQIFGSNPLYMAQAAEIAESRGADLIDINMGCPAPKIVKNGEGAALMKNLRLAAEIVRAVVQRVRVPVTVKMRKGWDEHTVNAVELAQSLADLGVAAFAVHGRTRAQFYSGQADWQIIAAVKGAVSVPVIGNGDIRCPEDALAMLEQTGCDGVMIGQAALGNPWIFTRTVHFLRTGVTLPEASSLERLEMVLRHLDLLITYKGERIAVREMRKHAAWYTKGLSGAAKMRNCINRAENKMELQKILNWCFADTCVGG